MPTPRTQPPRRPPDGGRFPRHGRPFWRELSGAAALPKKGVVREPLRTPPPTRVSPRAAVRAVALLCTACARLRGAAKGGNVPGGQANVCISPVVAHRQPLAPHRVQPRAGSASHHFFPPSASLLHPAAGASGWRAAVCRPPSGATPPSATRWCKAACRAHGVCEPIPCVAVAAPYVGPPAARPRCDGGNEGWGGASVTVPLLPKGG